MTAPAWAALARVGACVGADLVRADRPPVELAREAADDLLREPIYVRVMLHVLHLDLTQGGGGSKGHEHW